MTMWNRVSRSPGQVEQLPIRLNVIWDVKADKRYDVYRQPRERVRKNLVVARTRQGFGQLHTQDGVTFDLRPDTLLILPFPEIMRYHWCDQRWEFWWFEFEMLNPEILNRLLPIGQTLSVKAHPQESLYMAEAFSLLRRHSEEDRRAANSLAHVLLNRWLSGFSGDAPAIPHADRIDALIDKLYDEVTHIWTVTEMAREVGIGERRFRDLFTEMTGKPPKAFHDQIRLSYARDMLQQGLFSVSEISDHLGYSSAFHFSKAYKREMGHPPSKDLPYRHS